MAHAVLGMGCLFGVDKLIPEYRAAYDWCLVGLAVRTDNDATSWPAQYSTPYNLNEHGLGLDLSSWPALWARYAANEKLPLAPIADAYLLDDRYYLAYTRAALALAVLNGYAQLEPQFDKLDRWIRVERASAYPRVGTDTRWALAASF
jgi:hypothetical protein